MRLTKEIHTAIIDGVLVHRFQAPIKKLVAARRDIALRLYNDHMGPKAISILKDIPDGWLNTEPELHLHLPNGRWYVMAFSGVPSGFTEVWPNGIKWPGTVYVPVPRLKGKTYRVDDPEYLQAVVDPVIDDTNGLVREIKAARESLQVVRNFTTPENLIAAWPELKPFVLAALPPPKVRLPALQTGPLNTMLDLPVE